MLDLTREAFDRLSAALRDADEDDAADEVDIFAERCVEDPDAAPAFVLQAVAVLAEVMLAEPVGD